MRDIPDGAFSLLAVEHGAVSVGLEVHADVVRLRRVVEMLHSCLHARYWHFLKPEHNQIKIYVIVTLILSIPHAKGQMFITFW